MISEWHRGMVGTKKWFTTLSLQMKSVKRQQMLWYCDPVVVHLCQRLHLIFASTETETKEKDKVWSNIKTGKFLLGILNEIRTCICCIYQLWFALCVYTYANFMLKFNERLDILWLFYSSSFFVGLWLYQRTFIAHSMSVVVPCLLV